MRKVGSMSPRWCTPSYAPLWKTLHTYVYLYTYTCNNIHLKTIYMRLLVCILPFCAYTCSGTHQGLILPVVMAVSFLAVVLLSLKAEVTPLQQYSEHLCDVYLDEPDVHHSILPSKRVKFVEPLLVELDSFPSRAPISDFSVKGDLDTNQHVGVGQQINLSRLFQHSNRSWSSYLCPRATW